MNTALSYSELPENHTEYWDIYILCVAMTCDLPKKSLKGGELILKEAPFYIAYEELNIYWIKL